MTTETEVQPARHGWWWCTIRSLDRPALGRYPRCCRCPDRCEHPPFAPVFQKVPRRPDLDTFPSFENLKESNQ